MSVVTLTGFMGTGKSTVGKRLAEALKRPFLDVDAEIELLERTAISDIFAAKGEAYFRSVERKVLADCVRQDAVVASGGGAIVDDVNYHAMHAAGPIVCLRASAETILARTTRDRSRPLLNQGDRAARVATLLAERADAYQRADLIVDTTTVPIGEVVRKIRSFLKLYAKRAPENR